MRKPPINNLRATFHYDTANLGDFDGLESLVAPCYFFHMVLELKVDLSEALANEARNKGLLESAAVERMLRAELKRSRVDQLFAAADRLAAQALPPLSEEEVEAEIQAARAQRRAADDNNIRRSKS